MIVIREMQIKLPMRYCLTLIVKNNQNEGVCEEVDMWRNPGHSLLMGRDNGTVDVERSYGSSSKY